MREREESSALHFQIRQQHFEIQKLPTIGGFHISQSISIFYWKFRKRKREHLHYLWNPLNWNCLCACVCVSWAWLWLWPNDRVFLSLGNSLIRDFSFVFHLVGWTTFELNGMHIRHSKHVNYIWNKCGIQFMQHSLLTHSQKCIRERGGLAYTEKAFCERYWWCWWWWW